MSDNATSPKNIIQQVPPKYDYLQPFFIRNANGEKKKINSPLLYVIDKDDLDAFRVYMKKDSISPNTQYRIPTWEVPEATHSCFESLLQRAIWSRSFSVIQDLLDQGADPLALGYLKTNAVRDALNSCHHSKTAMLKMGKMLIMAGVKVSDIKQATRHDKSLKEVRSALVHYAWRFQISKVMRRIRNAFSR